MVFLYVHVRNWVSAFSKFQFLKYKQIVFCYEVGLNTNTVDDFLLYGRKPLNNAHSNLKGNVQHTNQWIELSQKPVQIRFVNKSIYNTKYVVRTFISDHYF